jgi:hypothetical protein
VSILREQCDDLLTLGDRYMRFKIGGFKFGHVPGTELSPTENARARNRLRGDTPGDLQPRPQVFKDALPLGMQPRQPLKRGEAKPGPNPGIELPWPPSQHQRPAVAMPDPRAYIPLTPPRTPLPQEGPAFGVRDNVTYPPQTPWQQQRLARMPHLANYLAVASDPTTQLNPGTRHLYERLNLRVTPHTSPAFTDAHVLGEPKKLGSGAFNTVFAVQLRNPGGTRFDAVFKPLSLTEKGWVSTETGIPLDNPQIAMRNIATATYASALGFDVIPDTRVALLKTPSDQADPSTPKLGLVMQRAAGETAAKSTASTLDRPAVAREVTKLQLLDHLTGQGDRHGENYFVNVDPDGRVKVTGIDNDQCFGEKLTHPEGIRFTGHSKCGFRGTALPPVVDHEMAIAITNLTPADVEAMLGDKLSRGEVRAANQRLAGVKRHIAELEQKGLVIHPDHWQNSHVKKLLTPENSYVARDAYAVFQNAEGRQAQAQW